ncbi:2,3-bisphosphoglycerate-independent phosphoglycerate mutase, partial [Patescibacteria group bacterium]
MGPSILLVIDGLGYSPNLKGNAVLAAKTPNLDMLWSCYPHTLIKAAEEEVGLYFGNIGNSEVGHMAVGTGRIIQSPLQRINSSIEDGSFDTNDTFLQAIYNTQTRMSKLHLVGMISSAGVHAELMHMVKLLELAKSQNAKNVFLHCILDGRDTGPKEALTYLDMLNEHIKRIGIGQIASIGGRAYAMDRNTNWYRTKLAYDTMCGQSTTQAFKSAKAIIEDSYAQGQDDEQIPPSLIQPQGSIQNNDSVIFTNFREDRVRQITQAFCDPIFDGFVRDVHPQELHIVTMTEYAKSFPVHSAFAKNIPPNTLSDVLESHELRQLHIAETEKYAHTTYFFNGGREEAHPHEEFLNVPSDPPEQFLNNPGMRARNITADHGNAEEMIDLKTQQLSKDHTINPVPFIVAHNQLKQTTANLR